MFEHFNLAWILKETLSVCLQNLKKYYVIRYLPLHWMQLILLQVFSLENAWELYEMKTKIEFTIVSQKTKRIHFTLGRTHFRLVSFAWAGCYSIISVLETDSWKSNILAFQGRSSPLKYWLTLYLKKHIWSSVLENGTLQLLGFLRKQQSWKQTGKYNKKKKINESPLPDAI